MSSSSNILPGTNSPAQRIEKRIARVSDSQWNILVEFLESHPNLARARGYNNSARGRAESARLWQEVANLLNAEGLGTTKTPKEWSIYVSNYKSKLKKIVADINSDATATGGGPPRQCNLSDTETRFLAILGPGFGQTAPQIRVNPFPVTEPQPPSTSQQPDSELTFHRPSSSDNIILDVDPPEIEIQQFNNNNNNEEESPIETFVPEVQYIPTLEDAAAPNLPRQTRRPRYRSRPLAPLDEARRILSQVEMQRAAADAARAEALNTIGVNLGRIADIFERYITYLTGPH